MDTRQQPKFMSEEDERAKFPNTDKQFTDGGGLVWTPRELSDSDIENSVQLLNYQIQKKTAKRGARKELEALVAEQLRREIRRNGGVDPEIGRDNCIKKARLQVMEQIDKATPRAEELILEVRTRSGVIWGQCILKPRQFKTGSQGFFAADRFRDPTDWTGFQVSANLVKVGSGKSSRASEQT